MPTTRVAIVRGLLDARRTFFAALGPDLFGDPAFELLLDLYASQLEGRRVCVSSACIAAVVPETTALRWLHILEERGFVSRTPDPHDRRRSHVRLSDDALRAIDAWLVGIVAIPLDPGPHTAADTSSST